MKLVAPLALLALLLPAVGAPAADVPGFLSTWSAAVKAAKDQDKPIYLHFTTTWCGWCRKIESETYTSDKGKAALAKFVPASLDCTVAQGKQPTGETKINLDLMHKWGGSGYPFLVMVTPDGALLNSVSGYVPPDRFEQEADKALAVWQKLKDFDAYAAKADKSGYEYNARALDLYTAMKQWDKAGPVAAEVLKLDPKDEKGQKGAALTAVYQAALAGNDPTAADAALKEITSYDPANDRGLLEEAITTRVETLVSGLGGLAPDQRPARFKEIVAVMQPLMAEGVKLKEPLDTYFVLASVHAALGEKDKALPLFQKALDSNPPDRAKQVIQQKIDQLKKK